MFRTGPGPDNGGPKPIPGCAQAPEKSGIDAALGAAGVTAAGAAVWPQPGAANAAVNITNTGKSLRTFMPTSRSSSLAPFHPRWLTAEDSLVSCDVDQRTGIELD